MAKKSRLTLVEKKRLALERYGFTLCARIRGTLSPEEKEARAAWKRDRAYESRNGLDECSVFSPGRPVTARQKIHEELVRQYGFRVWRSEPDDPKSPQEAEARHRYFLASEAAERARKREKLTAYNRDYRRRKRAEAFAAKQKLWTADEWAAWQEKERLKAEGPGTPPWVLKEVVAIVAAARGVSTDAVMERMLAAGGVDFVLKGAEAVGVVRMKSPLMLKAAARALLFYLEAEKARLFDVRPPERHVKANRLLKGDA